MGSVPSLHGLIVSLVSGRAARIDFYIGRSLILCARQRRAPPVFAEAFRIARGKGTKTALRGLHFAVGSMPRTRRSQPRTFGSRKRVASPDEGWFTIRSILDERVVRGRIEYLVDWDDNETTGEAYSPTWVGFVTFRHSGMGMLLSRDMLMSHWL